MSKRREADQEKAELDQLRHEMERAKRDQLRHELDPERARLERAALEQLTCPDEKFFDSLVKGLREVAKAANGAAAEAQAWAANGAEVSVCGTCRFFKPLKNDKTFGKCRWAEKAKLPGWVRRYPEFPMDPRQARLDFYPDEYVWVMDDSHEDCAAWKPKKPPRQLDLFD
jgi:hypothetical protein